MFDFENLEVYKRSRNLNIECLRFIEESNIDNITTYQLRRALFSISLNIAATVGHSLWRRTKDLGDLQSQTSEDSL